MFSVLDWQRVGAKRMVQHCLNVDYILSVSRIVDLLIINLDWHQIVLKYLLL